MSDKCWVLLNDNGGTSNGSGTPDFGPTGWQNSTPRYRDASLTRIIPNIAELNKFNYVYEAVPCSASYPDGYVNTSGISQSRLWSYDVLDNNIYFADTLPFESSDIGMGNNTFIVGCEVGIKNKFTVSDGWSISPTTTLSSNNQYTNLTLNQYSFSFSANSEPESFGKTPIKTFRLVTSNGQLIGISNSTTASPTGVPSGKSMLGSQFQYGQSGIGAAIGFISDNEVLVDDRSGNIYHVNLKDYYMGGQVFSHENGVDTAHPNSPGTYTDFTNSLDHVTPNNNTTNGINLDKAWAMCSHSTQYRVYTVIAKKVIDLNYPFLNGTPTGGLNPKDKTIKTQGDLTFIPSDASQSGQPTVVVTIDNDSGGSYPNLMPTGPVLVKYPIDLDTFAVSTVPFTQVIPSGGQVAGVQQTPVNTTAIVKEPSSSLYYLLADRKRYLAAVTSPEPDFWGVVHPSLSVDALGFDLQYYFWTSNMGQLQDTYQTGAPSQYVCGVEIFNFRGGSQPPDCAYPNAYTYNCTIDGCESVFSSTTIPAGQFATLDSCTANCVSYSCNSVTYQCFEVPGTGQTETFIDPDDCGELCLPPYWLCGTNGCVSGTPLNFVYTSVTECQASCETYNCSANGCLPHVGSGGTYTAMTSCTASCYSFEITCTPVGLDPVCSPYNVPYYGTGGTFTGASINDALIACTAATASTPCISWACDAQSVAANTDIYVYYDTTSMSFSNTTTAHNSIMQWTTTIAGWTGNIYHIPTQNERWLGWAGIPYQQPTHYGLRSTWVKSPAGNSSGAWTWSNIPRPFKVIAWGQSQPNGANWYDLYEPAFGPIQIQGGSYPGTYPLRGYPPYAGGSFTSPDYTVPVLNVVFADESDGALGGPSYNWNELNQTGIYYDVDRIIQQVTWADTSEVEPTPPFQNDYNRWLQIYNHPSMVYPPACFIYPTKPVNYSSWSSTRQVFKHMALSVLASISSGNMNQFLQPNGTPYAQNGLWSAGTAPTTASGGGTVGGVPSLCSIADLSQLETANPYWDAGYGGLDQYGWGTNISFPTYSYSQFQTDLDNFVTNGSVTVDLGCTSAATSVSLNFPYSSKTDCLNFCDPKWECTDTGCLLNSTGGTYDSYSACTGGTVLNNFTDACKSFSCSTLGCETYNSPLLGTGGTFTELIDCHTGCTSWSCSYVPPSLIHTQNGCVEYIGSGQTFSAESACTATCVSWDCSTITPCTSYPNTAHTFSTEILCTGSTQCGYYQCQVGGCIPQPGSYVSGINNYTTEQLCKDVCFGWGCTQDGINVDTNIYAFYDTSSMTLSCVQNAHNSLMSWVNSLPNYTGNTYHTVIDDERWLDWGNAVYSGSVKNGLQTPNLINNAQNLQVIVWASTTPEAAYWYDNQVPGTQSIFGIGSITTKGLPPTTSVTGKTLIINFIDEADGVSYIDNGAGKYHGGQGVVGNIPQFSGGSSLNEYQPTSGWTEDYTAWTNTYASVLASGGTTQGFVYPIECNQTQPNSKKTFALQVVASITPGDQPTPNGTFSTSTYPRTAVQGGVQGGVPPLCGIADLQMLSVTNPYYSAGTGNLAAKGWGYNIDFLPFNSTQFQSDLGSFLAQSNTGSNGSTPGTCVSAQTLWHQSITYPYSCETCSMVTQGGSTYFEDNCCSCNCEPPMALYACTTTGCSLSSSGTLTWDQCNNPNFETPCVSYSCTTDTGCEDYNFPNPQMLLHNGLTSAPVGSVYPNPVGGTGGTFTILSNCHRVCSSYNCVWDPLNMSIYQDGCLPQVGTGGTYYNELQQTLGTDASYSACTADCKSWECNNPCGQITYPTPIVTPAAPPYNPITGCTEYPNTGSTHLTEITCTASCEEHWYCYTGAGMTFLQNCLNAASTGIISTSFEGQISAIANNPTWQIMQFGNLRWDMTGNYYNPNPVTSGVLPLPIDPCEATAGHWARIRQVSHSTLGFTPYYTWSSFIDAFNNNSISPPLTYTNSWQDVISAAGPHIFCDWEWCNCNIPDCLVGCIDELPLPQQSHGSYTSSTAATEVCCTGATATTWSCQTTTQSSTCDGITLIPGVYNSPYQAYDYIAINFGSNTFSNYQYEDVAPPAGATGCEGPNGGQLHQLTGITLNNSILQNTNYTSWASFITALQAVPAPDGPVLGLVVGMPAAIIESQIQSYSAFCASDLVYGTTECVCTNTPCNCIELLDGTGTYTSQTECQLVCCNSGTSWNCQNGMDYAPNCPNKDYIGMWNGVMNVMDYFRINSGNTQFGLSKVTLATPNVVGVNPLTWAQVQANMGTAWNWQDCYFNLPGTLNYYAYQYVGAISHPDVNGGQTYNTWQSFSGAVTTAGVTFNSTDAALTVCNKIDTQIGAGPNTYGCEIHRFDCCRQESCYCYELFAAGGTYQTEPQCTVVCCPPSPMGWECTPPQFPQTIGTCLYVPWGVHATWNACMLNCTGETSWDCNPGSAQQAGIDSSTCTAQHIELFSSAGNSFNSNVAVDEVAVNYPAIDWDQFYWESTSGAPPNPNAMPCVNTQTGNIYQRSPSPTWDNNNIVGGIYQFSSTIIGNNWNDFMNNLNVIYQTSGNGSQTTTTPFTGLSNRASVWYMVQDTDPNYGITWSHPNPTVNLMGSSAFFCSCLVELCDCVEVPGNSGQYPTYGLCIPPCCQVDDESYDCTINGCVDPGGGYGQFTGMGALSACEDVCYEWVCDDLPVASNCKAAHPLAFYGNLQYIYGNGAYLNTPPRTDVNINATGPTSPYWPANTMWEYAQAQKPGNVIIDFFGNPKNMNLPYGTNLYPQFLNTVTSTNGTLPCTNPGTPGCVYNMQHEVLSNYKMDTTNVGPESLLTGSSISSYCNSPNGKWWKPTGIGVVNRTTGAVLIAPQTTWYALIQLIVSTYPQVCQFLVPGYVGTACVVKIMQHTQPHEINNALVTPLINGEFRLYGEGCVC